ncbi:MAG TPA: TonB-dependent receptor, partial [Blastocatellia bacterium]|nr:TonB-dependent receptor [Blastocatellia bacterium]
LTRYRAGLALGGPIVKDHTFYYTAFEQEHTRTQSSSDVDPSVASRINRFLATGAFPGLGTRRITESFFPVARAETEASAKVNHQMGQQHSLMLRYAFTNNREASDAFNTGGLTDASSRGSSFTEDHQLVGSLVSLISTNAVGDLRFQLATRKVVLRTNDQAGPEIDINGIINFGRPYEGDDRRRENHYQISYTLGLTQGAHLIRSGLTANHVRLHSFAPDGFGSVYLFGSLADFLTGRADTFRQAFGDPSTSFVVTSFGGFIQDHWSVNKRVTLDLGLRYDFEHLPNQCNQDTNNLSPRIGIAYSPSDTWVLRAGYGIFHDRYVLAFLNRALEKDGSRAFEQVVSNVDMASAIFQNSGGAPLSSPIATIHPSIFRADPLLAAPYSQQANLGIERLLTKNLTAGVSYLLARGVKLSRTRNVNLLPPVVLTDRNAVNLGVVNPSPQQIGREVFGPGRRDPRFNDIYLLEDSATSTYHGVSLTLNRRLADEFEFSASYTFSKTIDDASDFDEQPENPFNLRAERALSRNHQGHRFVLSALYDLPFGEEEEKDAKPGQRKDKSNFLSEVLGHIEVAPIVTIGSGRPINPLTGLDSNRSHAFPLSSRPLGFGRNTLKTPSLATVDLRVLKYFHLGEHGKLDFVVEAFNLFNHVNVSQIDPFGGPDFRPRVGFGGSLDAFNPRQFQFSIDFEF